MIITTIVLGFAAYGAFLAAAHVMLTQGWTTESGVIDANSAYYEDLHTKYGSAFATDSASVRKHRYEVLDRIMLLSMYRPVNAEHIMRAYMQSGDERIALRMLDAVDRYMQSVPEYATRASERAAARAGVTTDTSRTSVFVWMNIDEWGYLKEGIRKHKRWIDSASRASGVEARLIVTCLVGEQVRKINTRREMYKGLVAPLKSLSFSTAFSYGVTGIKESTARMIEEHLRDSTSLYYLGAAYEHLLDYDTTANYANSYNDTLSVRVQRLTQPNNHYYSYLYAALFVKQIIAQWERSGYPIADRPEILATIFNLGFAKSQPKANPEVGGAAFTISDVPYSFGSIAYEFYYSGEMLEEFPYLPTAPSTPTTPARPASADAAMRARVGW